mmetsp:Transcript_40131/g.40666  ORF Transcript_40131/g.40666 Transcript_40131/m.40666 type:complete len:100 (-) Transcript_40131:9-308(-)
MIRRQKKVGRKQKPRRHVLLPLKLEMLLSLGKVVMMPLPRKKRLLLLKKNLNSQKSKGGSVKRVILGTGRFAQTGNAWTNTSVDADTAVNDVNKDNESD